ncbi:hypothetical protein GE21DRAFT_3862 [Neurospora crassa]|uniref:Uncharacterized protein n=1 Tax=Neurospora crassa (strain ATCC 24698 / 74-OR23-1A / CBS 708.71 / DSM 1257 / FGSC 987) TaxID=367110 RepID=Q7SAU0_NEUCR|nr:hypothetical protein NCU05659 [Neurospora crassa OR74A]EAA33511.1 hypothetical protein NCU05659 [Neurospora crassa OR74A]KHE78344.1 hypothetical protein GE21DRAFT_3862 [Neurospora crassa]|eukprot:XP_962747.1 hypothetical protein NCU05659 [Neurospora crassa OR74A]
MNANRKWNPDKDDWPKRSITYGQLKYRLDNRAEKKGPPVVLHNTQDIGTEEFPEPVTHWIENWAGRSSEVSLNVIKGTEKLCREEAKDIGFTCVIIRSGIHTKTNQYNEDGTVLTEFNAKSGMYQNVVADDDPHITVYMGFGLDELVVQGHIYIVWDEKALFNMRLVKDPQRERKIVLEGREKVASEYWLI